MINLGRYKRAREMTCEKFNLTPTLFDLVMLMGSKEYIWRGLLRSEFESNGDAVDYVMREAKRRGLIERLNKSRVVRGKHIPDIFQLTVKGMKALYYAESVFQDDFAEKNPKEYYLRPLKDVARDASSVRNVIEDIKDTKREQRYLKKINNKIKYID